MGIKMGLGMKMDLGMVEVGYGGGNGVIGLC